MRYRNQTIISPLKFGDDAAQVFFFLLKNSVLEYNKDTYAKIVQRNHKLAALQLVLGRSTAGFPNLTGILGPRCRSLE